MMWIERIFPQVIQEKSTLLAQFQQELNNTLLPHETKLELLEEFPATLKTTDAFLDAMTGIWRYEFGNPSTLDQTNAALWGTQMWPPIHLLAKSIGFARDRLTREKYQHYLTRLNNIEKHYDALVEMYPLWNVDAGVPVDFEVTGFGVGNTTIDWRIGPINGREVLLEVKYRLFDLYEMLDQEDITQPQHDYNRMFSGVERKFTPANPDTKLQGVWINTQIKQDDGAFRSAFSTLDNTKVHFVILGDDKSDAFILAHREEDEAFLRSVLHLSPSNRFTARIP